MNTDDFNKTPAWLLTAVSCVSLLTISLAWLATPTGANGAATTAQQVRILADQAASAAVAAEASKPAKGTGNFAGVVTFDGAVPERKLKFKKGDMSVKDAAVCAAADMPEESLVVDRESKGIANVFVYLAKAPAGKTFEPPKQPAVFDQKGCRFLPHAMIVRAGQPLTVLSGDPVAHNTHTNPFGGNKAENFVVKANDRVGVSIKYTKAERLPVNVNCDFHTWMKAYHLVIDHPFGAVTDDKGSFEIKDLPPGKYEFVIWQESVGYLERKFVVDIAADKVTEKKIAFPASKFMK